MTANELRIGNWVINDHGKNYQINYGCAIDENGDYQPIPLTPEILEKAGFKRNSHWTHNWVYKGDICLNLNLGKIMKGDNIIEIVFPSHLHQLQNLYFALTGEELTIEL